MSTLGRREVLGVGLTAILSPTVSFAQSNTSTSTPLTAVVTIGGATYTYNQANGVNLGDFVSTIGGFTQACIRSDVTNSPLTVFFRPDRTSGRLEVVFELGRLWTSGTPAHLGAYTAQIYQGSTLLATIAVPAHYWYSRWRWQSAPRPVVGNVSQMIQQGLLPPYNLSSVAPPPPPTPPAHPYQMPDGSWVNLDILTQMEGGNYGNASQLVVTAIMNAQNQTTAVATQVDPTPALGGAAVYTVMGLAGVTPYMPQTGERPDIGLVTEPQAEYICTANTNSLQTVMAQGEAGGTMPWHMRDENTSAPVSFNTYPNASWYPDQVVGSPYVRTIACPVTLDSSHMPGIVYLPYLLTGDPYFLEELQFQANWNWGWFNPTYRPSIPQSRSAAWSIRTLAQVAKVTPSSVPSWLLPQSYWVTQLTNWEQFFMTYVNYPRADLAIFRACTPIGSSPDQGPGAPGGTWVSMWEDEFVAAVLGWVVQMGFTDWQTAFNWKIGSTIARTNGTSGWVRAQSTPYRVILRSTASAPFVTTWTDAYNLTASVTGITYTDPNKWAPADMTYLGYTRGALVYANMFNVVGASSCLSWATGQIVGQKWPTDYKWRIGTGL